MISSPRLERARHFWSRHRRLFFMLHSFWALATGIAVIVLARERYGFVPWVVVFLGLTWLSTMVLGWGGEDDDGTGAPALKYEVTGYFTRGLYQETLFFLLPFYAYSTVVRSWNVLFVAALAALALLSCLDLVFDRLLRTSALFGLLFFSAVAFSAVNLVLPILLEVDPRLATPAAGVIAVGSSIPLALKGSLAGRGAKIRTAIAAVVLLIVAIGLPGLIPPVPLRLENSTFAAGIDRETLDLVTPLDSEAPVASSDLDGVIVVLVEVFAPANVPARVVLEWRRDGELLRRSREVEIVAHEWTFRVWDAWRPPEGSLSPGVYRVTLRTNGGRVFGVADLTVTAE